jgi:hypothetical protein
MRYFDEWQPGDPAPVGSVPAIDPTPIMAVAVNRHGRYIRLEDDRKLPIVGMLDIHGKDTEDPDACIVALFERPDGLFSGVDLRRFDDDMQETMQ